MGILARVGRLLRSWLAPLLGSAESPADTLAYAYERQLELLQQARRSVVEVATARRRLQLQAARYREDADRLRGEAEAAVERGDDEAARAVLGRRHLALAQLDDLEQQMANLQREEQRLADAEARLAAQIEAFRTRKELLGARYSVAEAQVRVGEALSGLSREMGDVALATQRMEEQTRELEARAAAVGEMVDEGLLPDASGARQDRLAREIDRLALGDRVEEELAALKGRTDGQHAGPPG